MKRYQVKPIRKDGNPENFDWVTLPDCWLAQDWAIRLVVSNQPDYVAAEIRELGEN